MKIRLSIAVASFALGTLVVSPAFAVDFEFFKNQSCAELNKEMGALKKAESAVNESIRKKESKANTEAAVTAILFGLPMWGNVDHGDANSQLTEIRADIRFVTRAQKANKCI